MKSKLVALAAALVVGWSGIAVAAGGSTIPTTTPVTAMPAGTPTTTTGTPSVGPDCGAVLGRTPAPTPRVPGTLPRGPWPEHRLFTSSAPSVVDPQTDGTYVLLSANRHVGADGPFVLRATDLASHRWVNGPAFTVPNLTLADGSLWVFGNEQGNGGAPTGVNVVCQVGAESLQVIRSLVLPSPVAPQGLISVTLGPNDSVWIGYSQTLFKVSGTTGRVLVQVNLPASVSVDQLASDALDHALYVSELVDFPTGPLTTTELSEFDWRTGRVIHAPVVGPLQYSVGGASLLAVPGGVWASFRIGMSGLSALFAAGTLDPVAVPASPASGPLTGPFHWMMSTTMVAAGDDLFAAPLGGPVVCLNGATGATRAFERLQPSDSDPISLVAADRARRILYATDGRGLLTLRPPARCWGGTKASFGGR